MKLWLRRAWGYGWRALVLIAAFALVWIVALLTTNPVPGVGLPDNLIEPLGNRYQFPSPKGLVLERPKGLLRHFIVTYVHGISCHSPDYSAPFQYRLAKAMGFVPMDSKGDAADRGNIDWYELDGGKVAKQGTVEDYLQLSDAGSLSRDISAIQIRAHFEKIKRSRKIPERFADQCLSTGVVGGPAPRNLPAQIHIRRFINPRTKERITFVEVLWSPLSEVHKRTQLGFDMPARPGSVSGQNQTGPSPKDAGPEPTALNAALKSTIINGAVSDAIFYLGDGGRAVREAVFMGLTMTFNIAANTRSRSALVPKHILVTESLGSRIVFDALREAPYLHANTLDSILSFIETKPHLIFFANQLPLLEMANFETPSLNSTSSALSNDAIQRNLYALLKADQLKNDPLFSSVLKNSRRDFMFCSQKFPHYQHLLRMNKSDDKDLIFRNDGLNLIFYSPQFAIKALEKYNRITGRFENYTGPDGQRNPVVKEYDKTIVHVEAILGFLAGQRGGAGYRQCKMFLDDLDNIILRNEIMIKDGALDGHNKKQTVSNVPIVSEQDLQQLIHIRDIAKTISDFNIYDSDPLSNIVSNIQAALVLDLLKTHKEQCSLLQAHDYPYGCSIDSLVMKLAVIQDSNSIKSYVYSDPNDLLSYRVKYTQTRVARGTAFQFINVPVRLAAPTLPFPGASGLFAQPMDAHLLHKYDNKVLEYLVCGWTPKNSPSDIRLQWYPGTCETRPGNQRVIVTQ